MPFGAEGGGDAGDGKGEQSASVAAPQRRGVRVEREIPKYANRGIAESFLLISNSVGGAYHTCGSDLALIRGRSSWLERGHNSS
jgi:hypothetical protein